MTLTRLLTTGTAEERRLLHAATHDGPDPAFEQRLLGSLGLGLGNPDPSVTHLVKPAEVTHVALPSAAATHPALGLVLVKWVGIAAVALSLGVGSGFAAGSAWSNKQVASAAVTTDAARTSVMLGDRKLEPAEAPVQDTAAAAVAALPPTRGRTLAARVSSQPSTPEGAKEAATGLANEVRLVDEARAALRRGDAATCLRLIGERQRRVRNGVLGPEAALVRIEALKLTGDYAAVQTEGQRFLEQHRSGPLAARVRAILAL